jgi:enterochelin esterase-like enzyme
MIIVGIECGHEGNERLSEYLPFRAVPGFFRQFKPMGGVTMDWIVNEIKPYIDSHYPTLPDREHTGIAGSSMGGLMALYGGVHYNSYFSKAGCVSSAVGFCIRSVLKDIRSSAVAPDTRFFLSWGTKEAHGIKRTDREDRSSRTCMWNRRIAELLREKGADARLYCQVEGAHCEADWEKQLPIFMPWLWEE